MKNNNINIEPIGISGQQMLEMIGVLAESISTIQSTLIRISEVQDKHSDIIFTLNNNVQTIENSVKILEERISK